MSTMTLDMLDLFCAFTCHVFLWDAIAIYCISTNDIQLSPIDYID